MGTTHIVGLNLETWDAVRSSSVVQNQIAVALECIGLLSFVQDFDDAHVDIAGSILERSVEKQIAEATGCAVDLQRLVVDVLLAGGEVDAASPGREASGSSKCPIKFDLIGVRSGLKLLTEARLIN